MSAAAPASAPASAAAPPDVTGQIGNLGADLITLGELQLELLRVDSQEAANKAIVPGVLAFLGLACLFGACPLTLFGLSWWLADATNLTFAEAALSVAGLGLVLAGTLFFLAWRGLRSSVVLLNRSRTEFRSNLRWFKHVLSNRRRYYPSR